MGCNEQWAQQQAVVNMLMKLSQSALMMPVKKADDLYNSFKETGKQKLLMCCGSKDQAFKQPYSTVRERVDCMPIGHTS